VFFRIERDGFPRRPAWDEPRDAARDLTFDEPPETGLVERAVVAERGDESGKNPGKRKIL
jgi:hypothetical protein